MEAARLLGAPLARRIRTVALPLARPAVAAGVDEAVGGVAMAQIQSTEPRVLVRGVASPLVVEAHDFLERGEDAVVHVGGGVGQFAQGRCQETAARGILMDIGHGGASFNFKTARDSIADGLRPFSISTDLHKHSMASPVYDMATTLSKLLAVGLPFDDVVEASTNAPRSVLGLSGKDGLTPGMRADFTVFDLEDCAIDVLDSQGNAMVMDKVFEPRGTVLGCDFQQAARRLP